MPLAITLSSREIARHGRSSERLIAFCVPVFLVTMWVGWFLLVVLFAWLRTLQIFELASIVVVLTLSAVVFDLVRNLRYETQDLRRLIRNGILTSFVSLTVFGGFIALYSHSQFHNFRKIGTDSWHLMIENGLANMIASILILVVIFGMLSMLIGAVSGGFAWVCMRFHRSAYA